MSVTDELTGIHNRRFIMERLGEEFQKARRTNTPLAAIMLDLDHFKNINDTYGHPFGDVVLKTVAERVKGRLRAYDLFGRAGGEEVPDINTPHTAWRCDSTGRKNQGYNPGRRRQGTASARLP